MRRRGLLALATTGLVLVVAGCAPAASSTAQPSASVAGPAAATDTAPAASSPAPASPTSAVPTVAPTGPATCAAAGLSVHYADDPGGGTAGSVYGTLTFTNTTAATCVLTGFPGVSYVGDGQGTQIGAAADRTEDTVQTVSLGAGHSAYAQLRRGSTGPYGGQCQEKKVDGLRVYPPASKAAVFAAFPTTGCQAKKPHLLTVGPVTASKPG